MARTTDIETGTESDERADATAVDVSPDVWAYADDGEHATTWAVERVRDTSVSFEVHRHEAGTDEVDGPVVSVAVPQEETTEHFAQALADADPELAIELAREYWAEK